MKRSRKALSILLSLAMLVAMMLPMAAPAMAGATVTASSVPYFTAGQDNKAVGSAVYANSLVITLDSGSMANAVGSYVLLDLPSSPTGYAMNASVTLPSSANGSTNALQGSDVSALPMGTTQNGGYREYKVLINSVSGNTGNSGAIQVNLKDVYVPGGVTGDVKLTLNAEGGSAFGTANGSVVIGTVGSGTTAVTAESVTNFGSSGTSNGNSVGDIDVTESAPNSLEVATDSVKLTLPPGFTWNASNASIVPMWGAGMTAGSTNQAIDPTINPSGISGNGIFDTTGNAGRDLKVNITHISTQATFFKIQGLNISVDESVAKAGDVTAALGGSSSFSTSNFVIGHYGDYGFTTSAATTTTLIGGQDAVKMGELEIDEGLPGSFLNGRTITLTLPANVKWTANNDGTMGTSYGDIDQNLSTTNGITISWEPVGSDGSMIKGTLNVPAGTYSTPAKLVFKDLEVTPAVDYTGDIPVTIAGSCGVTGTVTLATVDAPISVSGTTPDMQLGLANQATGDVTITENIAGAVQANPDLTYSNATTGTTFNNSTTQGTMTLNLPIGVTFTSTPTVAVTSGDLQITDGSASTGTANDGHGYCQFTVKSSSTTASTVKVSNILLTVDRTVPQGQIYLKVKGNAVDETGSSYASQPTVNGYNTVATFPNDTTAAKCYVGNVVTPSQAASVVFTIGSTVYTVNGTAQVMDAAPYIDANGRSFVPVRYLANVLGVDNSNIAYDGSNVTLTKGSTKVQLTIGSNQITVNGTAQTMDTAPVINNGRTMLPARFVAEAFGAQVGFANNQVVVNLNPTGSSASASTSSTSTTSTTSTSTN